MSATESQLMCRHRDDVRERMTAGQPFGEVEDAIEVADLSEDQKAALWLLAFIMRDRHAQERDASSYLALAF